MADNQNGQQWPQAPETPYGAQPQAPGTPYGAQPQAPGTPYGTQPQAGVPVPPAYGAPPTPPQAPAQGGSSVAGLVCGIIGVVGGFLIPLVGIILGIIAITLSNKAAKGGKSGMTTGTLVLGVIAILVGVAMWVINFALLSQSGLF